MKYNFLKPTEIKRFKLPKLNGGSAFAKPSADIDDNKLFSSQNLWFKDKRLKTRCGLSAKPQNAVVTEMESRYDIFNYHLTQTSVNRYGIEYKIAYSTVLSDDYKITVRVYLVSSDVNIISVGSLTFLRVSSEMFNIPTSILFYTGTAQSGGGIYALVTLTNQENASEKYYNIYEINQDFTDWERVYDYYVPTILVNGRGNKYDIAHSESGITLPNVKTVESQNLLTPLFYSYYTSDGYSSVFRLPFCDLSSDTVVCRINYTAASFVEWRVSGNTIADTKSFMGYDIMLEVDREKATLSFFKEGQPYAIPIIPTYNENNIKVTAGKETENGFTTVVDSSCILQADGRVYLGGGQNGNLIITAKSENPLYFPKRSLAEVGGNDGILALALQSNKIIAFKQSETHYITLNKGKIINEIGLLTDNDKLFKEADILNSSLLLKNIGVGCENSICSVGSKTVWLANDRFVYILNSLKLDGAERISDGINIVNFEGFAVSDGEYYILNLSDKTLACDLSDGVKAKWYLWQMPKDLNLGGGFYKNGMLYFLCFKELNSVFYIATLSGDCDMLIFNDSDNRTQEQSIKIKSFMATKDYAPSGLSQRNFIETVYLALSGKGRVEIKLNGRSAALVDLRFSTDDYDKGEYKTVVLSPHLYDTEKICVEIASSDAFAVGDIEIFYRKTG